jgi:dihydroneopterin triphosphate diphosphatase
MGEPTKKTPRGSIPFRTGVVAVYIFRRIGNDSEYLLLKRQSRYMFGLWQQVAGTIEEGETALQAVIRELKEETGLSPRVLYSAEIVETFYDYEYNVINMVPIFVAEFAADSEVILSSEHSEYKWVSASEAKEHFTFPQQRMSLELIEREFVKKTPPPILKIEL